MLAEGSVSALEKVTIPSVHYTFFLIHFGCTGFQLQPAGCSFGAACEFLVADIQDLVS